MVQGPNLRQDLDEWVEQHVQDLEADGAYIDNKDIRHGGGTAEVTLSFMVPREALETDD